MIFISGEKNVYREPESKCMETHIIQNKTMDIVMGLAVRDYEKASRSV